MKKFELETVKAQVKDEGKALKDLETAYKQAKKDVQERLRQLNARIDTGDPNIQTVIYQKKYQEILLKQIDDVLNDLQTHTYNSANDFFQNSYRNGYIGSMYELHQQGIPITVPVNPDRMQKAIQTDSKISKDYYLKKGLTVQNIKTLKKQIALEATRGIASGKSWLEVAESLALQKRFQIDLSNAMRIVRTEGNRINQTGRLDAGDEAVKRGCDLLKQWDATLDSVTRPAHREADGQIVEWDEDFTVDGEKLKAPCIGGSASNVINCRCQLLKRPRWALDEEELETLKKRAEYYGLDKTKSFEDFKEKFLQMDEIPKLIESMRNKKIWNGLPEEKREVLLNGIKNGDPEFIKLAERCMDNCNVNWSGLGKEGTSCYYDGTGHIDMFGDKDDDELLFIFWHEYGHFLDDAKISGSGIKLVKKYDGGSEYTFEGTRPVVEELGYDDAMAKDVARILKLTGMDDRYYVHLPKDKWTSPWIYKKDTDEALDFNDFENKTKLETALNHYFNDASGLTDARNYLYNLGYPKNPKYDDYFEFYTTPKRKLVRQKEKFKGAKKAWEEALRKYGDDTEAFEKTHDMESLWKEQNRLIEEANRKINKWGAISDTLDESTYGMFMSNIMLGGHSSDYYRSHRKATEGVANVFSTKMTQDTDLLEGWEKIAPNLYDVISKGWMYGK